MNGKKESDQIIKLSDIIAAILSAISDTKEHIPSEEEEELGKEQRARTISPLQRNPVDLANLVMICTERHNITSPLH
jgi:hypothetical protein